MKYAIEQAERMETGLAVHYPMIHHLVVGMGARRTFEFGAGRSTRVFIEALLAAHAGRDGQHWSVSTETWHAVQAAAQIGEVPVTPLGLLWRHRQGDSRVVVPAWLAQESPVFDLVLHDGSHAADVVEADLCTILPHMRHGGLILVHDTMHSYVGAEMRAAIDRLVMAWGSEGLRRVTLPYGFGLTLLQVGLRRYPMCVGPARKAGSPHSTEAILP